jgi:hypothetical protein
MGAELASPAPRRLSVVPPVAAAQRSGSRRPDGGPRRPPWHGRLIPIQTLLVPLIRLATSSASRTTGWDAAAAQIILLWPSSCVNTMIKAARVSQIAVINRRHHKWICRRNMSSAFEVTLQLLAGALTGEALHRALERGSMLRRWLDQHGNSVEIEKFLAAETIRAYPQLYAYLDTELRRSAVRIDDRAVGMMKRDLHGEELLIPVAVIGTNAVELLTPNSWIIERQNDWSNAPHVKIQRTLGRVIKDNICYSSRSISVSSGIVSIKGGLTTYGSALASQDVLEWEFLDQARRLLPDRYSVLDVDRYGERLTRRSAAISNTENYLLGGGGLTGALAISTLVVYQGEEGEYRILIGKRSASTGAHAHLFHVIPACMFQPELGDADAEWSIFHNVLKEYLEELYSIDLHPNATDARYFYAQPRATSLIKALESGQVEFVITGVVVNLLNLRPEICALLLVKDGSWWRSEQALGKMNWEYAPRESIMEQSGRTWTDFRLESAETEFLSYFGATPGMWVPSGLASFWLGIDAARTRI